MTNSFIPNDVAGGPDNNWATQLVREDGALRHLQRQVVAGFGADSTQLDAFGRLRISSPQVLGYGSFEYAIPTLTIETSVNGAGAAAASLPNESSISLTTGAATSGNYAYAQTRVHHRYVPGRSQLVRFTGSFATPTANVRQRAGYFNDRNGLFVEYDGTDLSFVRRTYTSGEVVENKIPRASWSDPFDGSGPSGISLDLTTTWLCWMDLEWLGVGRYRFGFASPATGELVTCYAAAGTNVLAVPYIGTANLPVRYEIQNTGVAAAARTLKWICYAVDTEGGDEGSLPLQRAVDSGVTATALASGTYRPILAIRADSVAAGTAVPNRGQMVIKGVSVANLGNNPISVHVRLNPTTLTQAGGAIAWADAGAISEVAAFTNAADTVDGGTLVDTFHVNATATAKGASQQELFMKLPLVYTQLGSVQDVLAVSAAGLGGASSAVASLVWQELY